MTENYNGGVGITSTAEEAASLVARSTKASIYNI
jgi:hypothetical protein